jgi:hypothetical protein
MDDARTTDEATNEGGVVIPFPVRSAGSPPPLPPLARAIPTPGSGGRSSSLFEAALTRRFDREAA